MDIPHRQGNLDYFEIGCNEEGVEKRLLSSDDEQANQTGSK